MKKISSIISILSILAMAGCSAVSNKENLNIAGAYRLVSKKITDGKSDSVVADVNQLKIYTEDYFMTSAVIDSVGFFGVGKYSKDGTKLTEHVFFSSYGENSINPTDFVLSIKKTSDGHEQTMKDSILSLSKGVSYIGNYKYVGTKAKSDIDGIWKQIETYSVKEKDTTWDKGVNYKACYDGYVMWGDYHLNSTTQKHTTYMGFGTYEMTGDNKLKEYYIKSNYTINEGKTFYIDVEFRSKDEFKQTILDSLTGIRYIEVYQRLKKQL